MGKKNMLLKLLIRYGEKSAHNPSPRGCYERAVPECLKSRVIAENLRYKKSTQR